MRQATEERFDPLAGGAPRSVLAGMRYEHLHRYGACLELAAGCDVLDLACGEGYGSAMLGARARSVIGVDLDADAVARARADYGAEHVRFEAGDCAALPLADASVDLAVSFETLEHTAAQAEMLAEIRRVLRPGGRLVISSPNKAVYSDESGHVNRYHVRELYRDELLALLDRFFPAVRLYGQRLGAASFLVPLAADGEDALPVLGADGVRVERGVPALARPAYFVAVCGESEEAVSVRLESCFADARDDLLDALGAELGAARAELEALHAKHARTVVALEESKAERARLDRKAGAAERGLREQRERLDDQGRRMIALARRWRHATDALLRMSAVSAALRDQVALNAVTAPSAPAAADAAALAERRAEAAERARAAADAARAMQALIEVRDTLADQLALAVFDAPGSGP